MITLKTPVEMMTDNELLNMEEELELACARISRERSTAWLNGVELDIVAMLKVKGNLIEVRHELDKRARLEALEACGIEVEFD